MAMSPFLRRSLVGAGIGAGVGALTAEPGKRWEGAASGGTLGAMGGMGYHHFKGAPKTTAAPRPQGALPAGKPPLGAGPTAAPPPPPAGGGQQRTAPPPPRGAPPPPRGAPPPPSGGAAPPPGGSGNYRQQGPVGTADPEWLKGVSSQAEAKKRFREQARQQHPDMAGGTTRGMQDVNTQWKAYQASPAYGRMATAAYDDGTTDAWEFFMRNQR